MKQLKKRLCRNAGMTLIELVVGMMTFAIIAVAVGSILLPTLSAYSHANSLAESNSLLDNLSNEVLNDVSKARAISVSANTITIKTETLTVLYGVTDEGYLYRNDPKTLVFPKEYYKGKIISMEFWKDISESTLLSGDFERDSGLSFILKIHLYEEESELISRSYAAKPLGLNQS